MRPIHLEEADSRERTQIGEGLVKFVVKAGHLETGRAEGRYFLNHESGCDVCGTVIEAGDDFYLDPETGEVLCAAHGRNRVDSR